MEEFTNENIDLDKLPKYQEVTLTAPHPNYWKVILINIFIFLFFAGVCLTAFLFLNEDIKHNRPFFIGGYLVVAVLIFILYRASFKKRGFALREKDIVYKSGIIAETTTIVPLNRIQHVALDEGIFSRIFMLGKLQIFTAGGQSGHLHIAGIEIEKARSMKEILLRKLDQIETLAEDQ
ncbi:PH domain-containing protein [Pedobacter boryungensis]|uniref:PH domain-containing protein n=1 Tax=Pedobacter boryungensis TaxID=869962 RepID=A0ABX2DB30_9SPHI|nr:PH domain-containing protein [Pedobacter boryungensis]NQX31263.1 PH domain-containing protein [Pedobacter boryungensis]